MKPHAIMISIPYQGHINPFVHLAIKLASKGFVITFVHTEYTHHSITKSHKKFSDIVGSTDQEFNDVDVFSEARSSGLDIRYATISDGFPLEYDRNANLFEFWEYLLHKFPSHVDEFVGNLIEQSSSSDPLLAPFIVADTFASWPGLIARKYNMVNVSFWTQPAAVFAVNYHVDLLSKNGHFPHSGDQDFLIDYIPGVEPISAKDLMSHLQETDTTTAVHKIIFSAFEEVKKADFILHNTVQELEPHTLSVLSKLNPTYAIGPINFFNDDAKAVVSKSLLSEADCTKWLNSKPPGSVLYVSFGSLVPIDKQVIKETAEGLRISSVNFLWAIRPETVDDEINALLPIGFEDDVKDRGLMVPWCDQNEVLSHPAVGGFMTHCGWNSILESVWFGVPMICYPVLYDQPTNRKLVVDVWKVGINLLDGPTVDKEEVATKIKMLMSGETSDRVRNEMKRFEKMMHDALAEDGSSERNFDKFVKDLKDRMHAIGNLGPKHCGP